MNRFRNLPFAWIAAGVISYATFVVLTAPSTLMTRLVYRFSDSRVLLSDTQGTFWRGAGTATIVGPQNTGVALRTAWRFRPLSPLFGRIGVDVSASGSGGSLSGVIEAGPRALVIRRLVAAVPAGWVVLSGLPMLSGEPDGQLRLESPFLRINRSAVDGSAVMTWQNAGTSGTGALGSYRLTVNGQGPKADLLLETISEEAISASGRGSWTIKTGDAQLDGTLMPRTNGGALEPLLQFVGPDNGGHRAFSIAGHFPAF